MVSIKKDNLREEAFNITEIIRNNFLNDKGLLVQGKIGEKIIQKIIVDDFGDVAPFLSLYGGEDICKRHLDYLKEEKPYKDFIRLFEFTDLILGLIWYAKLGQYKHLSRDLAVEISLYVVEKWYSPNLRSIKAFGVPHPIINGIDSTFIEVWTEMFRMTGDPKYLKLAKETASVFIKMRRHSPTRLLPKHAGYLKVFQRDFVWSSRQRKIMKDNTNFCFGLLDLYRVTKSREYLDEVFDTTSELSQCFDSGKFLNIESKDKEAVELTPSFAVVDYCCDAYFLSKNESFLELAKKIADFWIGIQSKDTGLMPFFSNDNETYLDCETDMSVALSKLYECTGNLSYLESSDKILEGILSFHKTKEGFTLKVDLNTGLVVNGTFKTKFICLFIKLLHLKQQTQEIYSSQDLFMLMKDR